MSVALGSLAEPLTDGWSNCCGLAGRSALVQQRCRSSGAIVGAAVASWGAGCIEDPLSAKSKLVSVCMSKSGASIFATDVLTTSAKALSGRSDES